MTMLDERVAQAIYETNPIAKWPPADDAEREYWLAAARAAETIVIEECAKAAQVAILSGLLGRSIVATIRALKARP